MENKLQVGGVLQRSFDVWTSNFIGFVGLALAVNGPFILLQALPYVTDISIFWALPGAGGMMLTSFFVTGLITYAVFQSLRNYRASVLESTRKAVSKLVPMTVAWILLTVIFVLAMVIGTAPFAGGAYFITELPGSSTATEISAILLVIVGITVGTILVLVLSLALAVVIPAIIVEDVGPVESLKRSWELTADHRLMIFAIFIVYGLVYALVVGAVGCVAGLVGGVGTAMTNPGTTGQPGGFAALVPNLVSNTVSAVGMTFQAVLSAVIYHDLREIKEGLDIDALLDVFE